MSELNAVDTALLETIADMPGGKAPGAVNIRKDSGCASRMTTENIDIRTKEDKPGIDILIRAGTKNETCHIPVIITQSGLTETVYNDFYVGEDSDVTIIAGCGIHNCGEDASRHDGVHTFHIGRRAKVAYVEKHYGEGDGRGENIMNPQTVVYLEEGAFYKRDPAQIRGIDSTKRDTKIVCGPGAETVVTERLQTHGAQQAESNMEIVLDGDDSRGRVISRSVAQENSRQVFYPRMTGNAKCFGHVQCDS
ncbi:MAG: SufD family Fe-S cluster assembly protein, partial [Oscillospiraceae bacterium]|nr:SufD family Fe-S cluster assembly protein [Oscillospiraceae bacterium]